MNARRIQTSELCEGSLQNEEFSECRHVSPLSRAPINNMSRDSMNTNLAKLKIVNEICRLRVIVSGIMSALRQVDVEHHASCVMFARSIYCSSIDSLA